MRDRSKWLYAILLGAILLTGFMLRVQHLDGRSPSSIIGGDALEYRRLAEFFLDPEQAPPGNRFPGFSFLLVVLFSILPFSHDAILVWTSMSLGMVFLVVYFVLAQRLLGRVYALVVTAAVAVHNDIAANAHRGLSEEIFLVSFFTLLLLFMHVRKKAVVPWWMYGVLGLMGGWMALIRPDSGFVAVPLFLSLLYRETKKNGFITGFVKTVPVLVLPFLFPSAGQWYMESLGVQNLQMRAGRASLWVEFLLGRMPYDYMFYKETHHFKGWFLGLHSLPQIALMTLQSSVRNALGLGEALGGQIVLLVGLVGMGMYIHKRKDLVLPLAVPLVVGPQWVLVSILPEVDVFRYNIRALPLLMFFVLLGIRDISTWVQDKFGRELNPKFANIAIPIAVSGVIFIPNLLPFSLFDFARPYTAPLYKARTEYLPQSRRIHPALVSVWDQLLQQKISVADAEKQIERLLTEHEAYAPTHFTLGLLALQQKKRDAAIVHLEQALEIVPFFAEAGVWLAEVYTLQGQGDDALVVLDRVSHFRPDYPPIFFLKGNLLLSKQDYAGARQAYETYVELNHYQHRRALTRERRLLLRRGNKNQAQMAESAMENLDLEKAGLVTPYLWNYLSLDLKGLRFPKPMDQVAYYNMGLAYLRTGQLQAAEARWLAMTQLAPEYPAPWVNLGLMYAQEGQYERAEDILQRGLNNKRDSVSLLEASAYIYSLQRKREQAANCLQRILALEPDNLPVEEMVAILDKTEAGAELPIYPAGFDYRPAEIALPMTRVSLSSAEYGR